MRKAILFFLMLSVLVITVSADTLVVYAIGTNSDAMIGYESDQLLFSVARATNGNQVYLTADKVIALTAGTTSGKYTYFRRFGWVGNTSPIPDDAIIDSAIFSFWGGSPTLKTNGLGDLGLTVTGFDPTTPTTLQSSDYQKFTNDIYSNNITYGSLVTNGRNNFTITNLSFINKTGNSSLMVRMVWDAYNDTTGLTWSSGSTSKFEMYDTTHGTTYTPFLEIIYHLSDVTPVASFTANETTICMGDTIQFNDTSINIPTSWLWQYSADGEEYFTFSTAQNATWSGMAAGVYNIKLTATNAAGSGVDNEVDYITVNDCGLPVAGFIYNTTCNNYNITVMFNDTSTNGTSYYWDLGDGNTSYDRNITHFYDTVGFYTLLHNATNDYGTSWQNMSDLISVFPAGVSCTGRNTTSCTNATTTVGGDDEYPQYLIVGATLGLMCGVLIIRRNEKT